MHVFYLRAGAFAAQHRRARIKRVNQAFKYRIRRAWADLHGPIDTIDIRVQIGEFGSNY